ncbi:MAG: ISAs1 family transposase, partial [Geodermatophilales bacterium]|nr:ISAs1 family transposase [Geodermatophilales bacterium]
RRQGQRHSLAPPPLFAVLAVLAGATSYRRIRLFIGVHRERLNAVFGASFRRAPAINTLRTLFHALDPTEIEAAFRDHAEQLGDATASPGRRVIALDGKTLRGSFDHLDDRAAVQVLGAFASDAALILAHQEIAGGDEIAAAQALIERLGLRGVLFTADALHCQKNLRRRGRDRQRAAGAGQGQPATLARELGRPVRRPAPDRSPRHHRSSRPRSRGASPRRGLRRRAARSRLAALRRLHRARHAPHLVPGHPHRPVVAAA